MLSWCRKPRRTFHPVLVSEVTYVSEEDRERMFQHVHVLLRMRVSFGCALGHIRDRVAQKWVSRCREGDLAARCSFCRPEPAPDRRGRSGSCPLRPAVCWLDRPLSSHTSKLSCPLPSLQVVHRAPASVCHSRSFSAEVYFVFQLQYFLFEIVGSTMMCVSVVLRPHSSPELNSSLTDHHRWFIFTLSCAQQEILFSSSLLEPLLHSIRHIIALNKQHRGYSLATVVDWKQ